MSNPVYRDDQDLWDEMAGETMYQFWVKYPDRIKIPVQLEKDWSKSAWEPLELILREKPHTKETKCSPQSFRDFLKECGVRTLAAKGAEEAAMNYAGIEDKTRAARIILYERFMMEKDRFRNGMNIDFAFPYIFYNEQNCPLLIQ